MQLKDGKAILDFDNGKETLTATFSNWYDVMYNEDNLNGEKLQDVLKTPEAIEEFKKANELDDAEFDNLKNAALMEVLQMQIGVGMKKK